MIDHLVKGVQQNREDLQVYVGCWSQLEEDVDVR